MTTKYSGIVTVCETDAGESLKKVSYEIISEGKRLSVITGEKVTAIIVSDKEMDVSDVYLYGADEVLFIKKEEGSYFSVETDAYIVSEALKDLNPSIVLFGATDHGRILAPKVAALCKCGITADCTAFDINKEGKLVQIRPALGGNILAHIISPEKMPQMASVRPSVFKTVDYGDKTGCYDELYLNSPDSRKIVQEINRMGLETNEHEKIEDAKIVISVGAGIKNRNILKQVDKFAKIVGGTVACSRKIVESGWLPHSRQVGQSGKTISPGIYIAIGISGASQHLAGMKTALKIIAVNTDENADIFSVADIGFVMDAGFWLKRSIELLERKI